MKYLKYPVYINVVVFAKLFSLPLKLKNHNKKTMLIYTDSRGFEISKIYNKKNPFSSYVYDLMKIYNVTYKIAPKSRTTIIDFLYYYENLNQQFDYVLLHLGTVDFSPRPKDMLKKIYNEKKEEINSLFTKEELEKNLTRIMSYNHEALEAFYDIETLKNSVIPRLLKINNMIFIGSNRVLLDWNGNYQKERPKNINMIMRYNTELKNHLKHYIDLSKWEESEIKKFTVDNIHLNREGFNFLLKKILLEIEKIDGN